MFRLNLISPGAFYSFYFGLKYRKYREKFSGRQENNTGIFDWYCMPNILNRYHKLVERYLGSAGLKFRIISYIFYYVCSATDFRNIILLHKKISMFTKNVIYCAWRSKQIFIGRIHISFKRNRCWNLGIWQHNAFATLAPVCHRKLHPTLLFIPLLIRSTLRFIWRLSMSVA